MLSVIDWLQANRTDWKFTVIAPPIGSLSKVLHERRLTVVPFSQTDPSGQRRPAADIEAELIEQLHPMQVDLLHANSLSMGRLTGRIAERISIPTSAHLRDIIKLSQSTIRDLNQNQRLIAVSEATRQFHLQQQIDPQRIEVIKNGVDLQKFAPRARTGRLHRELNLPESARLIATIGQIGLRKGHDQLAQIAPRIVDQIADVHFLFLGERTSQKAESVEFEAGLKRSFLENGIAARLHWLGFRHDVAGLMSEFDLLVHPAKQEPYGRVLLEATASGLPIVATNVGGTAEIIDDQRTGRVVPVDSPDQMCQAIIDTLQNDQLRTQFGQAARQKAESQFCVSAAAISLSKCWEEIIRDWRLHHSLSSKTAMTESESSGENPPHSPIKKD